MAHSVDLSKLWDANESWRAGRMPWTLLAYPRTLADERGLPRDDESLRYLAELLAFGLQVGVWDDSPLPEIFLACPFEEREWAAAAITDLERRGIFPRNFAAEQCARLIALG